MDTIRSTATLDVVVVVMTTEICLFLKKNNDLTLSTAQNGWNVKLTTYLIPVENLRTSVALRPLSHVS